jgi:hypothetical protein
MSISRKYQEIIQCKIKGQNIHFTGEKEEMLPSMRQNLLEIIDVWGKRETQDPITYFKKKCIKSKIIFEEIEDLK